VKTASGEPEEAKMKKEDLGEHEQSTRLKNPHNLPEFTIKKEVKKSREVSRTNAASARPSDEGISVRGLKSVGEKN